MIDVQKIESIQSKGFLHFVLVHGILRWGFGTAVLASSFDYVMRGDFYILNFAVFPCLGVFFGAGLWIFLKWLVKRNR